MSTERRKFTDEEKRSVLQQAELQGISNILRHYKLSYSVYTRWKKKYMMCGQNVAASNIETARLTQENVRLKKIIADMALALELKDEEMKRLLSTKSHHLH